MRYDNNDNNINSYIISYNVTIYIETTAYIADTLSGPIHDRTGNCRAPSSD